MLSVANKPFMVSVIMLSVITLSVIMLSVIMLSVIMLSVITLSVIMLSVIILNVVAPLKNYQNLVISIFYNAKIREKVQQTLFWQCQIHRM
jgi:hypothetical protein